MPARTLIMAAALTMSVAAAQPSWERVAQLTPGQNIKVYLVDGTAYKGRLEAAGPERLKLRVESRIVETGRADVARVTRKSRGKGAMWGGLVTFSLGAPIGAYAGPYLADRGNPSGSVRLRHAAGWGLFFGGIGAGIGALTGMETTVYRSREPLRAAR